MLVGLHGVTVDHLGHAQEGTPGAILPPLPFVALSSRSVRPARFARRSRFPRPLTVLKVDDAESPQGCEDDHGADEQGDETSTGDDYPPHWLHAAEVTGPR